MRKTILGLMIFVAAISPALHAAPPAWVEVTSPHFVVLTDTNEKQGRKVAKQFEQMRSVFHSLFPGAVGEGGPPIYVIALKDKKGFDALEPAAYLKKDSLELDGLLMPGQDKNFVMLRLDAQGEHPFSTVYHEYTHYLLRTSGWIPLWMNEGLAEFYQNTDIEEHDILLGQASADDILYLRQNKILPLATLFTVDHASPYYHDEQKGSVFYAQSWALTHYIMMHDNMNKTHHLQEYDRFMMQGEDPVTAAQHAFGDLQKLQHALEDYIQQDSYGYFRINSTFTTDPATFKFRTVSLADADTERAEVLIYTQRQSDAETLLTATLRDDPDNAEAHAMMGFLKFSEQDNAGAKKWFDEAIKLHSDNYLAYYYDAVMSERFSGGAEDAEVEANLQTAIKLNPNYAASYDSLAQYYGAHRMNLDKAHILTVQAVQLEPDNIYYRLNAANVLVQQQNFTDAMNVLKATLPWAKNANEKTMVQGRIDWTEKEKSQFESRGSSGAGVVESSVVTHADGRLIETDQTPVSDVKYPAGPATGPQHTVKGVIRNVECTYPAVLALHLVQPGKSIVLYSNNYYKTAYSAANFTPSSELNPCKDIDGMKATIVYAEVSDAAAAGQIVSIELSK